MKVKLSFVSYIKINNIRNNTILDVKDSITIKEFVSNLNIKGNVERFLIPIVNDQKKDMSYILNDGDEIFLYLPVEGG